MLLVMLLWTLVRQEEEEVRDSSSLLALQLQLRE